MKKWVKRVLLGFSLSVVAVLSLSFTGPGSRYFEIVKNLELFANAYKAVNEYYVDEVNPSQLMNKGIEKMLGDLDPYTVYISEDKIEDFRTQNTGQYAGIGASTVLIDGRTYVSMVYEGFSAYKQGLRIGDEIIKVDGTPIAGLSQERLNTLVKGQAKTNVTLTVKRPGKEETLELKFEREKISIPNVPYAGMLDENIGYIKFTEFTPNGYKNVKKALQELLREGAEGIVLDLRGNLGGLLQEAVHIANLFIPSGLEVVHIKGKVEANNRKYVTEFNPLAPAIPLAILVNNMSASASEIVAGTLQDYDRAVLIGQKTFGKGLVQNTRDLPYHSKVKLTIAKYYIPSGRCIQAVDYSHRNPDGSVGKIPDSLKVAFTTKNGRTVYDGGGIDPEVPVAQELASEVARQLVAKGYIFRYASRYALQHAQISSPAEFTLTATEYQDFVQWVSAENFTFNNPLANDLEKLTGKINNSKQAEQLQPHIKALQDKLNISLVAELAANQEEIKRVLEANIASRYYLEPGLIEAGLGDDPYIDRAIAVLTDRQTYDSLLAPGNR